MALPESIGLQFIRLHRGMVGVQVYWMAVSVSLTSLQLFLLPYLWSSLLVGSEVLNETLSEAMAYLGMTSILLAFLLETRNVLHSKQPLYLFLMAFGSGLLGIRAYLISEWAFLVLEVVWCGAAIAALMALRKSGSEDEVHASS